MKRIVAVALALGVGTGAAGAGEITVVAKDDSYAPPHHRGAGRRHA